MTIRLHHLGWSGFRIDWPDGPTVFVDPPEASALPRDRESWIALTHGHPEHVAGVAAHIGDAQRLAAVRVVASPRVCAHLRRGSQYAGDCFHALDGDGAITLPGLRVQAFAWRHMPLLPPEPLLALRHLARLVRHPDVTFGILKDGLVGPPPGAMLGYRLVPDRGPRVLVYSEGVHRRTPAVEVRRLRENLPAELLLFAVEPEDAAVLPDLVAAIGVSDVVPYEAHRDWRAELGMPQADLRRLVRELASRDVAAHVVSPGRPVQLTLHDPKQRDCSSDEIRPTHADRPDRPAIQSVPGLERSSR